MCLTSAWAGHLLKSQQLAVGLQTNWPIEMLEWVEMFFDTFLCHHCFMWQTNTAHFSTQMAECQPTWQKTANSPVSHEAFPDSILEQGSDVGFHRLLLKTYGGWQFFFKAALNAYQKLTWPLVKNEQILTRRQPLHCVVHGVSRLFCAAVKLIHLNGLNFAVLLQIKGLKVPGGERDDVGRGVHCVTKVCKAFE